MKTASLPDFLSYLNSLGPSDFKGDCVDRYLSETQLDADDFLPYVYFREETYGRNLVCKADHFELLLLTWLPHQRTPIHDHAGQRCWMMVQLGALSFKNYEPIEDNESQLIARGTPETHNQGDMVYIDDGIGIHSICNSSHRPAISVHLYAGPIERCRIYNEARKRFEWKQLAYFTCPKIVEYDAARAQRAD